MTKKKDPKDLLPAGRTTKYKEEYDDVAYKYCLLGATDDQLAEFFDVAVRTISNWKDANPSFLQATMNGKGLADANMAEALYQRGLGYTHKEEKIFQYEGKPVRVKTKKHYPPDTAAASLWLRNRQPGLWRDNTDHTHHLPDAKTPEEQLAHIAELDKKIKNIEDRL